MSEYRQKIPGFVWPEGLEPSIRYLARDAAAIDEVIGCWFGFIHEPEMQSGWWFKSHGDDGDYGYDLSLFDLPCGATPLLLCRDDYEATTRSVTFHGVNSGDGESFRWGGVSSEDVASVCGEFAEPGQDYLYPGEILIRLGAMDGKRRKVTVTVEDVE